jgi:hypothetical protein
MIEGSGKEGRRRQPLVCLISNYYLIYPPKEQMGTKLIVPINNIAKKSRSRRIRKKYVRFVISFIRIACACVLTTIIIMNKT